MKSIKIAIVMYIVVMILTACGGTGADQLSLEGTEWALEYYNKTAPLEGNIPTIRFENGELTIHGQVCPRYENVNLVYGEYTIGDFHRTFAIGEAIDAEKISAEMSGGVLTLHLPKSEKVKPRRIAVKAK